MLQWIYANDELNRFNRFVRELVSIYAISFTSLYTPTISLELI